MQGISSSDATATAAVATPAQPALTEWSDSLRAAARAYIERDDLEGRTDVGGLVDQVVVMDADMLKNQKVVIFKHCAGCTIEMPRSVGYRILKVYIDSCVDCTFVLETPTITQHTELSNCDHVTVHIKTPTATVQADLCHNLTLEYPAELLENDHRVYHAGVRNLTVRSECGKHELVLSYDKEVRRENLMLDKPAEEKQFVAKFDKEADMLSNALVIDRHMS